MDLLLAIAAFTAPVLVLVGLSLLARKRGGTCGTLGADGRCGACGRDAEEMAQAHAAPPAAATPAPAPARDRSCP